MIELLKVSKRYGYSACKAVDNLSFTVRPLRAERDCESLEPIFLGVTAR
jgi:hypothetical protein